MSIPVYILTGFLEGGKTSVICESLADTRFNAGERTLIIACEEGIAEYDTSAAFMKNVNVEYITEQADFTRDRLSSLTEKYRPERIIIEYNGMWTMASLFSALPTEFAVYQNMMFAEAKSFLTYNKNMRSLVYDKLSAAEMLVINRTPKDIDKEEIHRVVKGVSRRVSIVYDYPDGHVEYDEIEDPLPFDKNAPSFSVKDEDYAIWYRDLSEDMAAYTGKTVKFKGMIAKLPSLPQTSVIAGRHVMTCCADDIQYMGLLCVFKRPAGLRENEWVTIKGKIKIEKAGVYKSEGPVIYVESTEFAVPPKEPVATFY